MTTVVVGAGIIGTAIAHDLQKRGRQVVLVDRDTPGMGASFGNMASIAVTEFMPASRPSVWRQIPGWMLDPEGPVRVRPSYMPKLAPWFLRFIAASRPSRLRELEAQGAALCSRALDDTMALLRETGLEDQISQEGCLSLYADVAEFKADREHIEILDRFGFPHEVIERQAIKALEPELSDKIGMAVVFPQNRSMKDPYKLVLALVERFVALGGRIERGEVVGFTRSDRVREVVLRDGRKIPADEVVICAGAVLALAGLADGAGRGGFADCCGQLAVAAGFAVGDCAHDRPHGQLEGRACRLDGQGEDAAALAGRRLPVAGPSVDQVAARLLPGLGFMHHAAPVIGMDRIAGPAGRQITGGIALPVLALAAHLADLDAAVTLVDRAERRARLAGL